MPFTSYGYPAAPGAGSIDAVQWAHIWARTGAQYSCDVDALVPSIVPTADRTIRLTAGPVQGQGVRDVLDVDTHVQLGTISSGSRWDLVVVRRSWGSSSGSTTLAVVPGTADQLTAIAARRTGVGTADAGSTGGDDQPIALAQVTATPGGAVISGLVDLRCFAGDRGVLLARDGLVLQYLTRPGTEVMIGSTRWTRPLDSSSWIKSAPDKRRWSFPRASSAGTDEWGPESGRVGLLSGVVTAAPAGEYVLVSQLELITLTSGSCDGTVWHSFTAGGAPGGERPYGADLDNVTRHLTHITPRTHPGGDLAFVVSAAATARARIENATSLADLYYLGPLA